MIQLDKGYTSESQQIKIQNFHSYEECIFIMKIHLLKWEVDILFCLFVLTLGPCQQFYIHVGPCLLRLNQFLADDKVPCSTTLPLVWPEPAIPPSQVKHYTTIRGTELFLTDP